MPNEEGSDLEQQIDKDFSDKIFSKKPGNKKHDLLKAIIHDDYKIFRELFENKVLLAHKADTSKTEGVKPLEITWNKLAEEIKYVNRFHLQNALDLVKLEKLLKRYKKPINKGRKFYRARISDEKGYPIAEMMNPPKERARSGRANPEGISYLYLADQVKTTLYETRTSLYDYVTIGEFRLKENMEVVNLRGDTYDPILLADNEELEDFLVHESFIKNLETHLSKPKRRHDNELDYLPTQYLSEFIKSIGFDGVEFQSSLFSGGYNLAIFSPDKFECINVQIFEIVSIDLTHRLL
ncbi:MAG: RES family NAD+ phosphorylase [Cyclobacteriaceae bacterium]|nr:RES family NAD+ phosphorylase [Cyclobacteriaceae bacterium]